MSSASYALALDYADRFQEQVRAWNAKNWPEKGDDLLVHAAKVCEEAGEVLGAIIKSREVGRVRPVDEIVQEFGDLMVTVVNLAQVMVENQLTNGNFLSMGLDKWCDVREYRTDAGPA